EIAERQKLHAMAGQADLLVDLEAALQLAAVVFSKKARERPFVHRRVWRVVALRQRRRRGRGEREGENGDCALEGHWRFPPRPSRPRATAPIPRSSSAAAWSSPPGPGSAG